jgi:DNA-binding transcriptional MerR regulator
MGYRVEEVAARCEVSVDTVRYYQSRGLVQPPERDGRVALYGDRHLDRIRQVRSLQRKGLTLEAIGRVLDGGRGAVDQDLAAAVAAARDQDEREQSLTLDQLVQRSGVAAPLIHALEGAGLPLGRRGAAADRYTSADADMLRVGLRLIESGLPLQELMALAAEHHANTRAVAVRAVELFDQHVRRPITAGAGADDEAAEAVVVDAFRELFPAVSALVALHFRRVLLAVAEEQIERAGPSS